MPLPLETPRLILRPFADRDVEPFCQYRSDPLVARYQGWEAPFPLEEAACFIAEMKTRRPGIPGEWFEIALEQKSSGALIGDVVFQRLKDDDRQAEIGYTLARPFQGQGYAAEAVTRLLDYLFEEWELHRVRADCDPQNTASARLLLRVGMRYEGTFMESLWYKGGWADEAWYAILRQEWEARR